MIAIDNTLISEDLIDEQFVCDLKLCKGACCVAGDSGAPLEQEEIKIMEDIFNKVKPYMSAEGVSTIEEKGVFVVDEEGDSTTPLIIREDFPERKECAFAIIEDGTARCSIEKAHANGKVDFRKPVSCHLYPVRIKKYESYDAVNVHKWSVCAGACELGKKLKIPVFEFVKEALIRKYGEQWFSQLSIAAKSLR